MQKESSWRDYRDIEAMLSAPKLDGVPLGTTLTDNLIVNYFNGHQLPALRPFWYYVVREWMNIRLARLSGVVTLDLVAKRKIWLTCVDSDRLRNIMLPIYDKLAPEEALLLTSGLANSMDATDRLRIPYYSLLASVKVSRPVGYTAFFKRLEEVFASLEIQYGLHSKLKKLLRFNLFQNISAYVRWRAVIRHCQPSIILTEFDRSKAWSPLILAARREGVPTITMVHGAMSPDAAPFVPVLADWIVCWGKFQKEALLAAGERENKILPRGNPALSRALSVQAAIDAKTGDDRIKPAVMLALSPVNKTRRDKLVDIFCTAATNATTWTGFVRLHPAERIANDAHFCEKYPKVSFHEPSSRTLEYDLATAAIVVVEHSSVGPEALMKGKLVVVLFTEDQPPSGLGAELVTHAGAPLARNEMELDTAIRGLLFDHQKREDVLSSAEEYALNCCSLYGEDSAQAIADFVYEITNEKKRKFS